VPFSGPVYRRLQVESISPRVDEVGTTFWDICWLIVDSHQDPIEEQIQRAIERGEFDSLPGSGRPLPRDDEGPGWWAKRKIEEVRRLDRMSDLARRIDQALEKVWSLPDVEAVEARVAELNADIEAANQGIPDSDRLQSIDPNQVVRIWRLMYRARPQ
jgi:hypothetical protein